MIRTLNVLAIATLIGSATAAYSVKYETILVAEKLRKRETELQREKDAIAVLQAEWQILNRPARLQMLAPPGPGMQALSVRQIVRAQDIPQRKSEKEGAADPLDSLLTGALPATPKVTTPPAVTPRVVMPKTTTPKASVPKAASSKATPPNATTPRSAALQSAPAGAKPAKASSPTTGAPLALRPPAPLGSTTGTPTPRRPVSTPQR